jgi:uncharacterized protein (TIGR01777 family)
MRVGITGATGFLGQRIVAALRERGDEVLAFSRNAPRAQQALGVEAVAAELETPGPWQATLAACDAIVHLAGESIAGHRWNARVKQIIRDSRVEGTRVVVEGLAASSRRPRVLVSASGADYYAFAEGPGDFADDEVTERDPVGDSFLSSVCRNWELEAAAAEKLGVRVVRMRTGLVLGPGGALEKMTGPFRFFVGGPVGSGKQWVSWIHVDDVVAAYLAAVDDARYTGPINLVAGSARSKELASALGAALHRPSIVPVPAFALKIAAGELAEYLLKGRNVVPARLRELGFVFKYPDLRPAVEAAVRPDRGRTSAPAGSGSSATP